MKVNRCESQNTQTFQSSKTSKRVMTHNMQQYSKKLLEKMNSSTQYTENKERTSFTSNILSSVNMGKKIKFFDYRYLITKPSKPNELPSLCTLQMGKNEITMDSNSGEILNYKKSMFRTWSSLLKHAERYLEDFVINFDNSDVVKKNFLGIKDFTPKGYKILEGIQNQLYYGKR